MKKNNIPCPCGGTVQWKKEHIIQDGVDCGELDIEYCKECGEAYFPEESMTIVEQKLKERGLWGMERKEIKFWKTGSSVTTRFPTEFVKKTGLDRIEKGYVYKEGENKLVIEY
jgi:hypothetical protein